MRLELGSPVNCTDGPFGELADVVIDPTKRRVTHLVVEPHGDHGKARLVPIELANTEPGESAAIGVRCSLEEAGKLEHVEEYAYIRLGESPDLEPGWDIGVESVLAQPYYGYGAGVGYETVPAEYDPHVSVTYDRVPKGEVEIRRASEVTSADGHQLGKVDGFLVDDDGCHHALRARAGPSLGPEGSDDPDQRSSERPHRRGLAQASRRTRSASSRPCPSTAGTRSSPEEERR